MRLAMVAKRYWPTTVKEKATDMDDVVLCCIVDVDGDCDADGVANGSGDGDGDVDGDGGVYGDTE